MNHIETTYIYVRKEVKENDTRNDERKHVRKSDRFKFVNILDLQRRKRKMLISETKSGVSALIETKVVPSQIDVSLNSSSNAMDTLSQGEEIDSKSNKMVARTEAAGKPTDFNNGIEKVDSASNEIDDTILNRYARSLNEPTTVGKNDNSNGKNSSNINSQVFAGVSYVNIVKQPNSLTRPSNIPVYVPPPVSPLKMQRSSLVNDLTQGESHF